MNELVKTLVLN